jgi:hypothetical protein
MNAEGPPTMLGGVARGLSCGLIRRRPRPFAVIRLRCSLGGRTRSVADVAATEDQLNLAQRVRLTTPDSIRGPLGIERSGNLASRSENRRRDCPRTADA